MGAFIGNWSPSGSQYPSIGIGAGAIVLLFGILLLNRLSRPKPEPQAAKATAPHGLEEPK